MSEGCNKKGCVGISKAIIGSTFIVGCKPCPAFGVNAKFVKTGVSLYRDKFRKSGLIT